jgi:hypothetical protein
MLLGAGCRREVLAKAKRKGSDADFSRPLLNWCHSDSISTTSSGASATLGARQKKEKKEAAAVRFFEDDSARLPCKAWLVILQLVAITPSISVRKTRGGRRKSTLE